MKLIGALTACLFLGAAHGRESLRERLMRQKKEAQAQTEANNAAAQAEIARQQREAAATPAPTNVGQVEQEKAVTETNAAFVKQQNQVHNLLSRHATGTNYLVVNTVDRTDQNTELVSLLNKPFFNAFAMVDLNNYAGSSWENAILNIVDKEATAAARIGLSLSTGSPVIHYVKEVMINMNLPNEIHDLTKRGHIYNNFMQSCEEAVAGIFFKLYSVFSSSRNAALELDTPVVFGQMDLEMQTYLLEEASYSLGTAGTYIDEIITLVDSMRTEAERLKMDMQSKVTSSVSIGSQLADPVLAKNFTNTESRLDAIKARKVQLEQQRANIEAELADIEARVQASSDALQAKLQARSDLSQNITPEKMENSPAHWRMFYEELCSWFAEWDCKYDATNVFQWVVDPTPIKAQYIQATKEIQEMEKLHDQKIARVTELLKLRQENTKLTIENAEQTGNLLHQISENMPTFIESGDGSKMYTLATRKLEQVSTTFAEIATVFKKWSDNLVGMKHKQLDLVRKITKMQTKKSVSGIVLSAHKTSMRIMTEQLLDCAIKGVEAWGSMEDIEYYRTFFMTTISTWGEAEIKQWIDDKDFEQQSQQIKEYYVQDSTISNLKKKA